MNVIIVDTGLSNIHSVQRALEVLGSDTVVASEPGEKLREATHVVLPGVGAFGDGMAALEQRGWVNVLRELALEDHVPFLGICLGMQLMAEDGIEGGNFTGLGLIPGKVIRLEPNAPDVRVPHVGWNEVRQLGTNPLHEGIPDGADFYFVHSYHFVTKDQDTITAQTPYCGQMTSGIMQGNIFGVQFHPEKSSRYGMQILRNFLNLGNN